MFAFGMHASKSYICLICSVLVFLLLPYLATIVSYNIYIYLIVGIFSLVMIFLYAPADTHKRPLINIKKRRRFKAMALLVGIVYLALSITIKDPFISNILIFSLLCEVILILPITYKIFKMPYRNYQTYKRQNAN
jgi:accessory gene regulator B